MEIHVYVCPTPGCGNYYGSSSMPRLAENFSGPKTENRGELEDKTGSPWTQSRAECPECRQQTQKRVMRELVALHFELPEPRTPVPDLPPTRGRIETPAA